MDFLDIQEKAREAILDLGDWDPLVTVILFQRKRRGDFRPGFYNFFKLLSENYPEVEFEEKFHQMVIRVKDGVNGSLIDYLGLVSDRIPFLIFGISHNFNRFDAVFRADGIGILREGSS